MANGLIIPKGRQLPTEQPELVRRLALRWLRAAGPHNEWAKKAKTCVNFLEGNQWTEQELAKMNEVRRTALTLNQINPLFRLVMGYQSSNRLDVNYVPTSDSQSSEDVAKVIQAIFKAEAGRTDLKYTDTEVFADGLSTGRGFFDIRQCYEENDFGEIAFEADDPFSIYVDPDCHTYDMDKSAAYIQQSVWTDLDRINELYGSDAAMAVQNISHTSYATNMFADLGEEEISPARWFGSYVDDKAYKSWDDIYHNDFVDRQAKRIRLLDTQYKMQTVKPCFIDLETGVMEVIPDEWLKPENHHRIQACLDHGNALNNPLKIAQRPVRRVRWTVTCSDVLLHDSWSPYQTYTKVGFFPYFRRGTTRGMIEDLIDPQREKNKKRSVLTDILNRNANSGWIYEENALDPDQEENLRQYGASPGIHVKWKTGPDGKRPEPKRLEPGGFPQGLDRLEQKAQDDMFSISGINESALGQLDQVQSGRAIEARQRQAVLSIQMYQDNFSRSKKLQGRKALQQFQKHYTEERIYRTLGEDSSVVIYEINKKMETGTNAVTRMNDITIGKYATEIDEVPISATFKQAQFEEMMLLLEKLGPIGGLLAQTRPDLMIDLSSMPRKQEWKQALMAAAGATAMSTPGQPVPTGNGTPIGPAAGTPEQVAT